MRVRQVKPIQAFLRVPPEPTPGIGVGEVHVLDAPEIGNVTLSRLAIDTVAFDQDG